MRNYPAWICSPCGERYGKRIPTCATWHEGDDCGWCGSTAVPVTEPRDFGYPAVPGVPVTRMLVDADWLSRKVETDPDQDADAGRAALEQGAQP